MPHALPPCYRRELVARFFPRDAMIPSGAKGGANAGFVFDRYLRIWHPTRKGVALHPEFAEREKGDAGKREDLQEFCDVYQAEPIAKQGKGLVATTHRRLDAYLDGGGAKVGEARTYATRWRVVTGLGGFHPLDNGFIFDRASAAPYFPGASVKGLCRAAAKTLIDMGEQELNELFGPDPDAAELAHAAGRLVFLPAFPARNHWPKLEVDLVNNHHPSYYRQFGDDRDHSKNRGPRETDSPIPVFFLTVAAGTPFTFRICDREANLGSSPDTKGGSSPIQRAFECLEAGLDFLGLGAKTAAGYGTFDPRPVREPSGRNL